MPPQTIKKAQIVAYCYDTTVTKLSSSSPIPIGKMIASHLHTQNLVHFSQIPSHTTQPILSQLPWTHQNKSHVTYMCLQLAINLSITCSFILPSHHIQLLHQGLFLAQLLFHVHLKYRLGID